MLSPSLSIQVFKSKKLIDVLSIKNSYNLLDGTKRRSGCCLSALFLCTLFLLIEIIEYKQKDTRSATKERLEMEVE